MTTINKIGTHDGVFHADEILAVALLKRAWPNAQVIRSRDPEVLATADVLVDVGARYEHRKVLDHHFVNAAKDGGVTMSSAGLVARDFREEVFQGDDDVADVVIRDLVKPVDAGDNGESNPVAVEAAGVLHFTLAHAVNVFNPAAGEETDRDAAFQVALGFVQAVLERTIAHARVEAAAAPIARAALAAADDPRIVVLESYAPVDGWLIDNAPGALFTVYPGPGEGGTWMVKAVPPAHGSFAQRKPLPEGWAGLRDAALAEVTEVEDSVFCHVARFICGAKSKEGALALAALAADAE